MSTSGVLFALIMAALIAVVIMLPHLQRGARPSRDRDTRQLDRARLYYARVLRNLRDLDEDHALGKLDPDSYALERELWAARGVQVLKAIDQLEAGEPITTQDASDAAIDQALDTQIEAAIRAARQRIDQ